MLSKRKPKNLPKHAHWRKYKKFVRNLDWELNRKGYFENCNYHPSVIIGGGVYLHSKMGIFSASVEGEDLITGDGCACSYINCNAFPLTEKEAFERRDFWKEYGEAAYWHKYVYTNNTLEEVQQIHKEFVESCK